MRLSLTPPPWNGCPSTLPGHRPAIHMGARKCHSIPPKWTRPAFSCRFLKFFEILLMHVLFEFLSPFFLRQAASRSLWMAPLSQRPMMTTYVCVVSSAHLGPNIWPTGSCERGSPRALSSLKDDTASLPQVCLPIPSPLGGDSQKSYHAHTHDSHVRMTHMHSRQKHKLLNSDHFPSYQTLFFKKKLLYFL